MHILHIIAGGDIVRIEAAEPSLDLLRQWVGGYIEVVHPVGLIPPYVLLVDDESHCKGKPLNILASCLYGRAIVGDAVLLAEDGSNLIGLTTEQLGVVTQYLREIMDRVTSQRRCPHDL